MTSTDPLDRHLAAVTAEITRTDTKAAALLSAIGLLGTALGVIVSSGHVHAAATVLAALTLGAAFVLAALVIRPRLGARDRDRASFLHWAQLSPDQLDEALANDRRRERLITLSVLCHHKMRHLRAATDVTIAAGAAVALAAALTATR
ncbi:Pycsar system effector family protein [Kitasatospora sp. NPDC002551]|uniref:Pycsar system effector family protein n=1 Tax=Kitasatospora sp. NPDC002551 TaxID=3154539 RepID=UPI00332C44D2